eukprot:557862-Pyramimonas_sp.AAC.1
MSRVKMIQRRCRSFGECHHNFSDLIWREPRACGTTWYPCKRCRVSRLPGSAVCINFTLYDVSWIARGDITL